jgi:HPt (histidine-containing phosphotransfer) domain-containing protein
MTPTGGDVLDPAALERLVRLGGQDFLIEMIQLFLENAPERLRAARRSVDDGDPDGVYLAAHSLKSTAGNLGARGMQEVAERLEERARDGDLETVAPLVQEAERAYEPLREKLEAELKRRSAAPDEPRGPH